MKYSQLMQDCYDRIEKLKERDPKRFNYVTGAKPSPALIVSVLRHEKKDVPKVAHSKKWAEMAHASMQAICLEVLHGLSVGDRGVVSGDIEVEVAIAISPSCSTDWVRVTNLVNGNKFYVEASQLKQRKPANAQESPVTVISRDLLLYLEKKGVALHFREDAIALIKSLASRTLSEMETEIALAARFPARMRYDLKCFVKRFKSVA